MPRLSEFIQNQKELIFAESPTNGREKSNRAIDFGDGSEMVPSKGVVSPRPVERLSSHFEDSDLNKKLVERPEEEIFSTPKAP